jgi:hypothetical protein
MKYVIQMGSGDIKTESGIREADVGRRRYTDICNLFRKFMS